MRRLFTIFALAAVLAGCGKSTPEAGEHDEGGHEEHGAEGGGAAFKEGKGISLVGETQKALGLKTAEVTAQSIEPVVHLTAQVYQSAEENFETPLALATATTDPATAERIRPGERVSFAWDAETMTGSVKAVDATQHAAIGKVEVLLELADPKRKLTVGTFVPVTVSLPKIEITGIPRSAVLETSTGKFAYVQNGDFLLRTPIATGIESEDIVEITDGLYEGDVVVSEPVEPLYLIELRATKGGGHSH